MDVCQQKMETRVEESEREGRRETKRYWREGKGVRMTEDERQMGLIKIKDVWSENSPQIYVKIIRSFTKKFQFLCMKIFCSFTRCSAVLNEIPHIFKRPLPTFIYDVFPLFHVMFPHLFAWIRFTSVGLNLFKLVPKFAHHSVGFLPMYFREHFNAYFSTT